MKAMRTRNITKERLAAGEVAFGLGVRFSRTVDIARMARAAGYHYLFLDMEHSTLELETIAAISIASLDVGVTVVVRTPGQDLDLAARILDAGALGIAIPHVNSVEEARQAVAGCKFGPLGQRSVGGSAIPLDFQPMPTAEAARRLNDLTLLVVLLETPEAIASADAIAAVEGIDVLSIGSNDLAMTMGIPGEFDHPRLLAAYETVRRATEKHHKALRIGGVYTPSRLARELKLGSRMVTLGNDSAVLLHAMRAAEAEAAQIVAANI
jgi:2-keto-3-deoxy-L-rhamnonate aldolase RhmA